MKKCASRTVLFAGMVLSGAWSLSAQAPPQMPALGSFHRLRNFSAGNSIAKWELYPVATAAAGAAQVHQDEAAADTSEFLARESKVRHFFLERYPPTGRAAQIAKLPTTTADQRFDISVALVMASRLLPANRNPPGYWRVQLTSIIGTQTMGTGLERFILGQTDESQPDPKSVDMLAKQNMQIFKAMAVKYAGIAPEKFDALPPLLLAQYTLAGAKGAAEDILFPCPYTVYLLDEDKQLEVDQPHFARDFFGHLAGRSNEDYAYFDSYNRQQRTQAFQKGFVKMIERGRDLALHYDPHSLDGFAGLFGMSVITPAGSLSFNGSNGKWIPDDALVASIFGLDGQRAFRQMAEGSEKNDMRTAAFLLMCERDAVLAPMMLG